MYHHHHQHHHYPHQVLLVHSKIKNSFPNILYRSFSLSAPINVLRSPFLPDFLSVFSWCSPSQRQDFLNFPSVGYLHWLLTPGLFSLIILFLSTFSFAHLFFFLLFFLPHLPSTRCPFSLLFFYTSSFHSHTFHLIFFSISFHCQPHLRSFLWFVCVFPLYLVFCNLLFYLLSFPTCPFSSTSLPFQLQSSFTSCFFLPPILSTSFSTFCYSPVFAS